MFVFCLAAILHPADPDGRRHHRHGRHEGGHRPGLPPPHVRHHRWDRERRLQRHADVGWRRRDPAIAERRAGPPGHRPVCPLPQLQACESVRQTDGIIIVRQTCLQRCSDAMFCFLIPTLIRGFPCMKRSLAVWWSLSPGLQPDIQNMWRF